MWLQFVQLGTSRVSLITRERVVFALPQFCTTFASGALNVCVCAVSGMFTIPVCLIKKKKFTFLSFETLSPIVIHGWVWLSAATVDKFCELPTTLFKCAWFQWISLLRLLASWHINMNNSAALFLQKARSLQLRLAVCASCHTPLSASTVVGIELVCARS